MEQTIGAFGMMQAVAEGFDLLTRYHERLEIGAALECELAGLRRGAMEVPTPVIAQSVMQLF